jgi:hypothetical protein
MTTPGRVWFTHTIAVIDVDVLEMISPVAMFPLLLFGALSSRAAVLRRAWMPRKSGRFQPSPAGPGVPIYRILLLADGPTRFVAPVAVEERVRVR